MKRPLEATAGIGAGIAAPIVYAAAVIVGGWFTPGYSQMRQTISELTSAGAPAAGPLGNVFIAYNLLLACFAIALPAALPDIRSAAARIAAGALIVVAASGVGMSALFPLAAAAPVTAPLPHIVLAAVASLATMVAILAMAVATWRVPRLRWFARTSVGALVLVAGSGVWAALAIGTGAAGLAERVTIGTFMAWLLLFAAALALPSSQSSPSR